MKEEIEILAKLRDRIHRAQRRWFKKFPEKSKQELYTEFQAKRSTNPVE